MACTRELFERNPSFIDVKMLHNNDNVFDSRPVTRILVALPRSWKNMETHGRLTKTHGKT